ncbi:hypothetical protein [Micromonospora sp. WMMD987]|jgi:hypothetical protein|uniref:hypothetical protein n=1 Tax=Micromonospora TaxID=1873 RepID=UPI00249B57D5|nr:hypothetical protein [Micromonospora sp. WMMD987]WFE95073.1 hypothetical protein O7612_27795 [Micromonospora sp. WMMD987]
MRALNPIFVTIVVAVGLLTGCSAEDPGSPAPGPAATTGTAGTGTPTPGGGTAPTAGGPTADGTTPTAAAPAPAAATVTLTRSGGFAGTRDTVTVGPDGHWTTTDRAGTTRSGRLEPTQLDRLRTLAGPATREGDSPPDARCADTFAYRLTIGAHSVDWTDCPGGPPPPAAARDLATLLLRATTTG